ncbi:MAG: PAS domain S-box protein [Scytonema sp. CRU_2_7]|nr:PAS domain S-box protein [Scytonema sp. CRU_2_7]
MYKQVPPSVKEACRIVVEQGEWQGELDKITKSGQKIIVQTSWTLMRDEAGKPKSVLVVNTDITEKNNWSNSFIGYNG